jgi:uncharacterized integral membrane protein
VRIVSWIIGLPVALAAIAFAVANRQDVDLDLWPLPFTLRIGIYLAVLGALAAGLLIGLFFGWAGSGKRASARAARAEAKARTLAEEVESLRADPGAKALPSPDFPA